LAKVIFVTELPNPFIPPPPVLLAGINAFLPVLTEFGYK
jgi:hypothetical protein